jgi:hypothetical protein
VINSEINLLDAQLRTMAISKLDLDCGTATGSIFNFADKVYEEAKTLEGYDAVKNFIELKVLHKRYDLLRTMLWFEAADLREKCGEDFHTVVYLYDYESPDLDLKSRQGVFGKVLEDLKEKHGAVILLIPIARNLGLESINLISAKYNITESPAIIIDEEHVIMERLIDLDELETVVFQLNN